MPAIVKFLFISGVLTLLKGGINLAFSKDEGQMFLSGCLLLAACLLLCIPLLSII